MSAAAIRADAAAAAPDALADPATARRLLGLALDHGPALEGMAAAGILAWAAEHVPGPVAVTLSMQDTVLADLAARHAPEADLIFLDTGYHFAETLDVAAAVAERYPNRLLTVTPEMTRAEQDAAEGPDLWARDPGRCCALRKVRPLAAATRPHLAWVSGLKRCDAPTRARTPVLEIDRTGRLKLNPLAAWTEADVERYIAEHGLIVHPLTRAGYPSIGCAPCTARVAPGADPRSGRWSGHEKTECGLHL